MTKTFKSPTAISNLSGVLGCCLLLAVVPTAFGQAGPPSQNPALPPPCDLPAGSNQTVTRCTSHGIPAEDPAEPVTGCSAGGDCFDCDSQTAHAGCKPDTAENADGDPVCTAGCTPLRAPTEEEEPGA